MENKTLLTNHQTAVALLLTVAVGVSWFYWFEYLPFKTEKACSDYLWERSVLKNDTKIYKDFFKVCINSGGPEEFKQITDKAMMQAKIEKEEKSLKDKDVQAREVQIVTTPNSNQ